MKKVKILFPLLFLTLSACSGGPTPSETPSVIPSADLPSISEITSETPSPISEIVSVDTDTHVTGITLDKSSATVLAGEEVTLIATIAPSDATNKNINWSTSNANLATVSDGVVSTIANGTVVITATSVDGGFKAECKITIEKVVNVTGVKLSKDVLNLNVGETYKLTGNVVPTNATNTLVHWSSDDETIATVDDNGNVVALKEGTTNIKITSAEGQYTKSCVLKISDIDAHLVAGSTDGIASKEFSGSNGIYSIEKYDEVDYSYMVYDDYVGNKWFMEATIFDVVDGFNKGSNGAAPWYWWTAPVGIAGVTDLGVYTFGALSYDTYNSFDAITYLNQNYNPQIAKGNYWNFKANLGGNQKALVDTKNGYKVGVLRYENYYYYFINDILIGQNTYFVAEWGNDSPAICTCKSGAKFKNIHVYFDEDATKIYDRMVDICGQYFTSDLFQSPYFDSYEEHNLPYGITLDGDFWMTNNSEAYPIKTKYRSDKFYFEATFSELSHQEWIDDASYPWVSCGVGHCDDGTRYLTLGPSNNKYTMSMTNEVVPYNADFHQWQYPSIHMQISDGLKIEDKYKVAILRDGEMVYFYINDVLVHSDGNRYCWELVGDGKSHPMIGNEWGGSGRVSNIKLVKDSAEIDAIFERLAVSEKELKIPEEAKVIILAGQSNAEGHTPYSDLTIEELDEYKPNTENIQIYYDNMCYNNTSNGKFRYVNYGQARDAGCLGPEIGMTYELTKYDPENFYYIIKVTLGGSNLHSQWKSPSAGSTSRCGELYTRLLSDVYDCFDYFDENNIAYTLDSFVWMQGEADGCDSSPSQLYYENQCFLYEDLLEEFSDYYDENAPMRFIDAEIKGYDNTWRYHQNINTAKADFEDTYIDYGCVLIRTNELGLRTRDVDAAHYTGMGQINLGKAFGDAILGIY